MVSHLKLLKPSLELLVTSSLPVEMTIWYMTYDTFKCKVSVVCRDVDCQNFILVTGLISNGQADQYLMQLSYYGLVLFRI